MLFSLIFWALFGWLADNAFPFGQALELILACFKGTLASKVNNLQKNLQQTATISDPANIEEIKNLNNLESQAWLYEGVLNRLANSRNVSHEKIAKTIEALEYKRNEFLQELEPHKPNKYRIFERLQKTTRGFLATRAEKDYEYLKEIIDKLVDFAKKQQSSPIIISQVIDRLTVETTRASSKISPYRLRLAYKVDELLRIISAKTTSEASNSSSSRLYQNIIKDLKSQIQLLSQQFGELLINKKHLNDELDISSKSISDLTSNLSSLQRLLSNQESDISILQKNLQEVSRNEQAEKKSLRNQIIYLEQQIRSLETNLDNASRQINERETHLKDLQSQNDSLNEALRNVQQDYHALYGSYQEQEEEIDDLNEMISAYIQDINSPSVDQALQKEVEKIYATKSRLSEEEWQDISNQNDYIYIKPYTRRDGTWVRGHYRKKPNR